MEYDYKGFMEDTGADFANMISRHDWKGAQAIIDNLFDLGLEDEAVALRKEYLQKQYESTRSPMEFILEQDQRIFDLITKNV